jgi:8-oxo-dGDP phosphatase
MGELPSAAQNRAWSTLSHQVILESRWFEVRRDDVIRPDGSRGEYDHVVAPASVTVLAIDENCRVAVTRQWIYVYEERQWRLPGGRIDDADADVESAARRELCEETGIVAKRWKKLGTINDADAFTNHRDHVFLATGLSQGTPQLESGEADLRLHWLPFEEVVGMVFSGQLPHAGSSFAVLMAKVGGLEATG